MTIKRNMVIWAELKSCGRSVQNGMRPCIVISNNTANIHSPVFTVIPGTTKNKKDDFPVHFSVLPEEVHGRLYKETVFMGEQICTIGKNQIINVLGIIRDKEVIDKINSVIKRELSLESEE